MDPITLENGVITEKKNEFRMYDHTAFIANLHHWIIFNRIRKCDEGADEAFSKGDDFWKIFVR